MTWKDTDLRKLLKWGTGFFQEDDGKPSQKRIIAFALGIVLCKHALTTLPTDSNELLITIFSFIAVLLGMTYIPTRNNTPKP
jgi:hypothetical protein